MNARSRIPGFLILCTLGAMLLLSHPSVAQHAGGCACGRHQQQHPTWEIDHTNSSYRTAAEAEFDKWHRFVDRWGWTTGDGAASVNGKNEIIFFTPTTTFNVYGLSIDADTFGIAYLTPQSAFGNPPFNGCPPPSGTTCGTFTETDVIMNANFTRGWTTQWPDFDDSNGPANYGATALHELGHTLGLHHNFSNLSTMNYFEDFAGIYLSRADAVIARLHYPSEQQTMTDLGTYPFRYSGSGNGYSSTTIASVSPTAVNQGASFALRDVTVENPGTTTLSNVRLSLYLSADTVVSTSDHLVGSLSWSTFSTGGWWDTTSTSFTVPESIPAGTYYVGAIVTYNTSTQDNLTYNNSWILDSARRLTVHDAQGPDTSSVSAAPNPTNGATLLTVNAIVNDATKGGSNIAAAELFVDAPGTSGLGYPMFVVDGSYDSYIEAMRAVYSISGWTPGTVRTLYIHGRDNAGNWGSFATTTVTVTGTGCTYSLSPTAQSFGASGGSSSFTVTTQSGCSWSASTSSSWISITSGSGTGTGTVSFNVGANSSTNSRSGTITAGGQTYTVSQSGISCSYSLSPTSQSFGPGGGSSSFSVNTQSGCSWSASTASSWISITSGSGSGNGTVSFNVAANSSSLRSGTITVAGQTFLVTQSGTTVVAGPRVADFDGDGTSDWVIYRNGAWLYFGPCAHPLTQQGLALNASCSSCVTTVCNTDSFCCNSEWDEYCVAEAASWCP